MEIDGQNVCSPWADYVHGQVVNVTGGQFTGMTT
jgi:3-oxoacyl-[acyl-carrier protein] reductase